MPMAGVDHLEFYLLNYFKPGRGRITNRVVRGQKIFEAVGCAECHIPNMTIIKDRRVADVETNYDGVASNGVFNTLFATAVPLFTEIDDGSGLPFLRSPTKIALLSNPSIPTSNATTWVPTSGSATSTEHCRKRS